MSEAFVWFHNSSDKPNESKNFYEKLLGWKPSEGPGGMTMFAGEKGQGPLAGLAVLDGVVPPAWLEGHYLWDAVLADLHHRAGNVETAARHRDQALAAAPSAAVRQLLQRRLTKPAP